MSALDREMAALVERDYRRGRAGFGLAEEAPTEVAKENPLKAKLREGILALEDWDLTEAELLEKYQVPSPATVEAKRRARFYIPKGVDVFNQKTPPGLYIVSWEQHGNLYAIAFSGERQKPDWYLNFGKVYGPDNDISKSAKAMRKRIDDTIKTFKARKDRKAAAKAEQTNFEHAYKVGDILYSSWGYDQTNVDFYEVTATTKKSIKVRKIAQKVVSTGRGSESVVAVKGKYIDKQSGAKRVRPGSDGRGSIKIASYANAYHWDGRPKHQTDAYSGH